jgi:hypothetical protein
MRLGRDLDHPDVADHVRRLSAAPDQPQRRHRDVHEDAHDHEHHQQLDHGPPAPAAAVHRISSREASRKKSRLSPLR